MGDVACLECIHTTNLNTDQDVLHYWSNVLNVVYTVTDVSDAAHGCVFFEAIDSIGL